MRRALASVRLYQSGDELLLLTKPEYPSFQSNKQLWEIQTPFLNPGKKITLGLKHTCVIQANGQPFCFGNNDIEVFLPWFCFFSDIVHFLPDVFKSRSSCNKCSCIKLKPIRISSVRSFKKKLFSAQLRVRNSFAQNVHTMKNHIFVQLLVRHHRELQRERESTLVSF